MKNKIRSAAYLLPIVLVYVAIIAIYFRLYSNTIEIIESEFDATSNLVEQSIYNETKYTEIISQIVERDIDQQMKSFSNDLVDYYGENSDVSSWDLEELRKNYDNMEIYIINSELEVIESTLSEEIGLNFEDYSDFTTTLKRRLKGTGYRSDKINFSIIKKELKKYSYIPTPDNNYLIELSIDVKREYPAIKNLNILYLSRTLKEEYPFVEDIRVYKYNKDKENSRLLETSEEITLKDSQLRLQRDKNEDKHVKKALETDKVQSQIIKDENNNNYTFKYIPYTADEEDGLGWFSSYVIEVLYNDHIMMSKVRHQRNLFVKSMVAISLVYFMFISVILYFIEKNKKIAYQDHLTKLANRKKFEEVLADKMEEAKRNKTKLAILFFDLDKFKNINDTMGHNVGDKVLQEVANRIKNAVPKKDLASRLGGDEFIALISNLKTEEDIIEVAKEMTNLFDTPLDVEDRDITMGVSIGISIFPDNADTSEQLIVKSDNAMYYAKQNNMGYKIYNKDDF